MGGRGNPHMGKHIETIGYWNYDTMHTYVTSGFQIYGTSFLLYGMYNVTLILPCTTETPFNP